MISFYLLLSGFLIAILASLIPGLINMTAAKISMNEGKTIALSFVLGALVTVLVYVFVAVIFAQFISRHLEIVSVLKEVGVFVFGMLSIYFFWVAKKPNQNKSKKLKVKGKSNRFFFGMVLSSVNVLPIPFYVFTSMGLYASGYLTFEYLPIITFVLGVLGGTFLAFYIYVFAFRMIEKKAEYLLNNFNTILGSVTGVVAVFTLYELIYS